MSRSDRLAKKKARLAKLETLIEEQEGYDSLTAQGMFGAETKFANVSKLYRERDRLETEIVNLEVAI